MFDYEDCWICHGNCTHFGFCGEMTRGTMTYDDRMLFNSVKGAAFNQNPLVRCCCRCPYICFGFLPYAAVYGLCCENSTYSNYKSAQLNQGHRFRQTVCCNIIIGFTMNHDPNYKYAGFGSININNTNVNDVKTGDVNVRTGDVSNNTTVSNTLVKNDLLHKVAEARIAKLIDEGRFSDAEMVAVSMAEEK